jgi:glutaredoxin-like protein
MRFDFKKIYRRRIIMSILPDEVKQQLSETLESLGEAVSIQFFKSQDKCNLCKETEDLLSEVADLSNRVSISVLDFEKDKSIANDYGIDKVPGFTILKADGSKTGMKFYGPPAGYEINSFIFALLEASGKSQEVPQDLVDKIKAIDKKVNIKVFVGLSCPHCPGAVITANKLSLLNPNIDSEMIEASLFDDLSNEFGISSVPRIFFNDSKDLLGAQPLDEFLKVIDSL